MNRKRLNEILWEKDNENAKYKTCAWEYFEELLPQVEEFLTKEETKAAKAAEPKEDLKPKVHKSR